MVEASFSFSLPDENDRHSFEESWKSLRSTVKCTTSKLRVAVQEAIERSMGANISETRRQEARHIKSRMEIADRRQGEIDQALSLMLIVRPWLDFLVANTPVNEGEEPDWRILATLQETLDNDIWQVIVLLSKNRLQEQAVAILQNLLQVRPSELRGEGYLGLGQLMEHINDFASALFYYKGGLREPPGNQYTEYFLRNNAGYCLNQLGQYQAAELFFHQAVDVDPKRQNAFKNLGISLRAQGKWFAAAGQFILATKKNAADPRAIQLLEEMIAENPDIFQDHPTIREEAVVLRSMVDKLAEMFRKRPLEFIEKFPDQVIPIE